MPKEPKPTEYELQILQIVWRLGSVTVDDVSRELQTNRSLAYTTVQTMLNRMVTKKLLVRVKEGRSYRYAARVSETATKESLLRRLVHLAFGGSARSLVSGLLRQGEFTQEDLQRLALEIENAQKQEHPEPGSPDRSPGAASGKPSPEKPREGK
jgi:predicted transcriptional regulator